ncbi:MAG: arsenite methyltransferase [Thermoanaerobaculales bacterium]|nr:arsenite methyltransferase [Thermoanaerobaculales bacterium]
MTVKNTVPSNDESIVATVRDRYGRIAAGAGSCCAPAPSGCCPSPVGLSVGLGYRAADLELLPEGADLGLGCGAPVEHLGLRPGETVVDLGSGAGIDALIAARAVGSGGRVIGIDMTPEMLARARANAATSGLGQVEFREGRLEALPVADGTVDAITSNCVINLVPDKGAVFAEIARVLRPGGRLVVSDVMLDGDLPEPIVRDVTAYVGCVAGAIRRDAYLEMLAAAGLGEVEILKDVDFLATVADSLPEEINTALAELGLTAADLEGVVRSVTYRARKGRPRE